VLANCPFGTFFSHGKKKKSGVAPKSSHYAWQGTFLPPVTDVQVLCHAEEIIFRFQLIFLLQLIFPEYSFISHLAQHCLHTQCCHHLSKFTVARNMDYY
jgi:hypothetical protein